ncbi:hypothetical protein ACLB2K_014058 [Fragaria x ananassa]
MFSSLKCLSKNPIYSIPRRWHLGHSHGPDEDYGKEGEKIFRLGLAADIGLASGKALTGYLSGSTAVIADAAHSVSDVVLSSIALLSFKVAKAPRDKEHPYGHGKFETLGALGISCMLLGTAGGIGWHALDILMGLNSANPEVVSQSLIDHNHQHSGHHHGVDMEHPSLALSMTVLSIAVEEGRFNSRSEVSRSPCWTSCLGHDPKGWYRNRVPEEMGSYHSARLQQCEQFLFTEFGVCQPTVPPQEEPNDVGGIDSIDTS